MAARELLNLIELENRGYLIYAVGAELCQVVRFLERQGRKIESVSRGPSNSDWVVMVPPAYPTQTEFRFGRH